MQRSKMRKLVRTLPKWLPEEQLDKALEKVSNDTTRTRLKARHARMVAGR